MKKLGFHFRVSVLERERERERREREESEEERQPSRRFAVMEGFDGDGGVCMGASEPQPPQPPQLPPDDDDALFLEDVPQDLRYDTLEGEREREGEREGERGRRRQILYVDAGGVQG